MAVKVSNEFKQWFYRYGVHFTDGISKDWNDGSQQSKSLLKLLFRAYRRGKQEVRTEYEKELIRLRNLLQSMNEQKSRDTDKIKGLTKRISNLDSMKFDMDLIFAKKEKEIERLEQANAITADQLAGIKAHLTQVNATYSKLCSPNDCKSRTHYNWKKQQEIGREQILNEIRPLLKDK